MNEVEYARISCAFFISKHCSSSFAFDAYFPTFVVGFYQLPRSLMIVTKERRFEWCFCRSLMTNWAPKAPHVIKFYKIVYEGLGAIVYHIVPDI